MAIRSLVIALLAAAVAAPLAAAPVPQPIAPEARWFTIGTVRVASLHDGDALIPNDGKTFGVDAGSDAVAAVLTAAGRTDNMIPISVSSLLVMLPGRVVVIDTGLGTAPGNALIASLAAAGVAPAQVTDVLITHSHGDHIGGLITADGTRAFPNAKVRMAAAEWTFLQSNAGSAKIVAAITPQVATFAPGAEVVPGITAYAVPGHTPGHMSYMLVSGKAHIWDIGDTVHSSIVSLAKPLWTMGFDSEKKLGKASRFKLLFDLSHSHEMIFAPHFPYPGVGTVAAKGDGFVWVPSR